MGKLGSLFSGRRRPVVAAQLLAAGSPTSKSGAVKRSAAARPPSKAFTPTQPKTGWRQVIGREQELIRILRAIVEDRFHVVLFAERGRGKTSVSNLVTEALRRNTYVVARYTCDAESNFDAIIRGLMHDLPPTLLAVSGAASADDEPVDCIAVLPRRQLRPGDVLAIPDRLACSDLVCVIDEFDRVSDAKTRTQVADTIKQLSDRNADLRFLIVGVSDDLDSILGQHPSIQRNVLGVHLPLLSDEEVARLIEKGSRETGISFPPPIVTAVVVLARGMPYIAQLVGLRLAQSAAARGDTMVSDIDLQTAVSRLLTDANPRVSALYAELTADRRDRSMVNALAAAATSPQDPFGRSSVIQLVDGSVRWDTHVIATQEWHRLESTRLIQKCGEGTQMAMFRDRELMLHVLLLMAQSAFDARIAGGASERKAADIAKVALPHV